MRQGSGDGPYIDGFWAMNSAWLNFQVFERSRMVEDAQFDGGHTTLASNLPTSAMNS